MKKQYVQFLIIFTALYIGWMVIIGGTINPFIGEIQRVEKHVSRNYTEYRIYTSRDIRIIANFSAPEEYSPNSNYEYYYVVKKQGGYVSISDFMIKLQLPDSISNPYTQ